jgi:hypothetical protein
MWTARRDLASSLWPALSALALYLAGSLLLFGRDVAEAPATSVVGDAGADKTIFMWSFEWWPHAIGLGHDPLQAGSVWAPHGIDLAWVTSVPLLSLLATPLTATAGSVAAYNAAVLAAPVLSAFSAYLLARYLTRSFWPSVVAGWIFGFSAFEIGHMVGHLNLVFLPFVPLCALLGLKHVRGELRDRTFVLSLAVALAGQFLVSTELFLDVIVVGCFFLVASIIVDAACRRRLTHTMLLSGAGALLAGVLVAPVLWHAFVVSGLNNAPVRSPYSESADLLNYVSPTRRIWLQLPASASLARHFSATGAERGAYLGLPLLFVTALFIWRRRRSPRVLGIAIGLLATIVASIGASVRVAGHAVVPAPWRIPAVLPVTRTILPIRLTLFVVLVVAMIVAAWVAEPGMRIARWGIVAVGLLFVLPNPASSRWRSPVPNPAFFRSDTYATALSANETVLVLPYGGSGWSLLWQAEDRFAYRLVGGHLGRVVTPREERWRDVYLALGKGPSPSGIEPRFRCFLKAHGVGAIVVAPGTKARVQHLVDALDVSSTHLAGVEIYPLGPSRLRQMCV